MTITNLARSATRPGIFVSFAPFVTGRGGGVQACTSEYMQVIELAGYGQQSCLFEADRRLSVRIRRRIFTSPYTAAEPPGVVDRIVSMCSGKPDSTIFLNQVNLAVLAPKLKALLPSGRIVVLSHGLESTDLLHAARLRRVLPIGIRFAPHADLVLGNVLRVEAQLRRSVDAVCTLSPFDADLERWLGARHVTWLPRAIEDCSLEWRPRGHRLGFVGTLDHAPNLDGLVKALDALAVHDRQEFKVRVVGGPASVASWLRNRYAFVEILGQLDDSELAVEAATWNAFLHPMFCLARGCNTKLATALSWQIPIVTSEYGHRGYVWSEGRLTIGNTPEEFASRCLELLDDGKARLARSDVRLAAGSSPRIGAIADQLARFLATADAARCDNPP